MQYDGIQPQIHYPFEHLPDRFEQADPPEIPAALWNQNNNDPEQLAGDDAMGPDCLDQLDEQSSIIPSGWILQRVGVLLILDSGEPPLDIFSTHPRRASSAAIGQLGNHRPNLAIFQWIVVDTDEVDKYWKGGPRGLPPRIQVYPF